MERDQVLTTLRRHSADLKDLGASRLFLFGSVAKNEAGPDSDVDLFFDFDSPRFSLIELVALSDRITELLHARADVMSRGSIHPRLRSSIEGSALQVF
ncbi:MAG TPA: nucleotidyltransferase domain-containing protein [Caulobacteraceae bacterium]|nr:nucleotidyltransferase domain-containing protein [Caulobacteraceae bacterium]